MIRCPRSASPFAILLLALGGGSAAAADLLPAGSRHQPVLLTAREVGYDEKIATATAIGNVEVVQGDTVLIADRVDYDQGRDTVHAAGHVRVLEPSGDVLFADDAVLTQQMEKGVVEQFRARLKDNSLFAAREARKLSKNVTQLTRAVYSPCPICAPKPGEAPSAPLWQLRAKTVTIDEDAQRVRYRDAWMEVYGVPVAYTPYLTHPTPDAPSESGLLQPQYFHATDLGNVVKEPVYLSLAPNMDATLTPWYLSGEKPLLEAEFRHLLMEGSYELRGAVTDTYKRDVFGNVVPGSELRGYVEAHGRLQLTPHWDAGIDAERTTDDTFLQVYRFSWRDMLTSRLYAERIEDRSYAMVESLAFQGLQPQDIGRESPYVLPQASLHFESEPLAGHSRLQFDSNALVLTRREGDQDQRVSSSLGWKLPYVTKGGQVYEAVASLRADAYHVSDQLVDSTTGETFNGDTGRAVPQLDLNWRYPFINRLGEGRSLTIAPIVELVASPDLHLSSHIPNEDSQIAELSDINLFSPDRFPGLDELESGLRGTYGMRGQLQIADDKYVQWMAGQAWQENEASPFPLTQAQAAHFSDYVGRLALKYRWIDVAYSFRVDRRSLVPTSNEVMTNFHADPLALSLTLISLKNEPIFGDRKEVFGDATLELTKNWRWMINGRRDLGSSVTAPPTTTSAASLTAVDLLSPGQGTVGLGTGLTFHNECLMVTTALGRSYITQQDVKPSTTFSVTVVLKNFGSPAAQTGNPTGAGNIAAVPDAEATGGPAAAGKAP